MSDELYLIQPYRSVISWGDGKKSCWVFDNDLHDSRQEPFVAGAGEMLDAMTAHIPNAQDGFVLAFAAQYYPAGPDSTLHTLKLTAYDWGGAWYQGKINSIRMHGWLGPSLLKYFPSDWGMRPVPPTRIYVSAHKIIDLSSGPPQAEAHAAGGRQGGKEKGERGRV